MPCVDRSGSWQVLLLSSGMSLEARQAIEEQVPPVLAWEGGAH